MASRVSYTLCKIRPFILPFALGHKKLGLLVGASSESNKPGGFIDFVITIH
jgi:hypothetical protein